MYGNNDYRDYLMHWGKGESAPNHKYSAKEWINGAWRYFYNKATTGKIHTTADGRRGYAGVLGAARATAYNVRNAVGNSRVGKAAKNFKNRGGMETAVNRLGARLGVKRKANTAKRWLGNRATMARTNASVAKNALGYQARKAANNTKRWLGNRATMARTNASVAKNALGYQARKAKNSVANLWNDYKQKRYHKHIDEVNKKAGGMTMKVTSRRDNGNIVGKSYTGTVARGAYSSRKPR